MIINGKSYKEVDMTFNTVCKLESMGVSITGMEDNLFSAARAYAALCMRKPLEVAGKELEAHIIGGGDMAELMQVFARKVEESDFFQALRTKAEIAATDEATEEAPQMKKRKSETSEA